MTAEYYATDIYDSGGDTFAITFDRISDTLIKCVVDDVETENFTILNDVLTLTDGPVLAGVVVIIYRSTVIAANVDWNTARFTSVNLQSEEEHMITIQQELYDFSTRVIESTIII
jgi:hypothetical protein